MWFAVGNVLLLLCLVAVLQHHHLVLLECTWRALRVLQTWTFDLLKFLLMDFYYLVYWQSKQDADICAGLSRSSAAFWASSEENKQECRKTIEADFVAKVVAIGTPLLPVVLAWLVLQCARATWCSRAEPRSSARTAEHPTPRTALLLSLLQRLTPRRPRWPMLQAQEQPATTTNALRDEPRGGIVH